MRQVVATLVLLVCVGAALALACRHGGHADGRGAAARPDTALLATRLRRTTARLEAAHGGADTGRAEAPIARWLLPRELDEVSGLALTRDGRLLAHQDERAAIFEIDYRRGVIAKIFSAGDPVAADDFEGLAVAGDSVVLLTSTGQLYVFAEGRDGAHVPYRIVDTGLGRECELEGLAYDAARHALVLGCKTPGGGLGRRGILLYRVPFGPGAPGVGADTGRTAPAERIVIDARRLPPEWKGFHPSAVEVHPTSGHYVVIAGDERAMLEVTPAGDVVRALAIPGEHPQPEGLTILPDLTLVVSDEARGGPAAVTLYPYPR
jgi:hypothetical protein